MAAAAVIAENERAVLERVGTQLAGRLEELRTVLLRLARGSTDTMTRQRARAALDADDAAELGAEYRPPAWDVGRVLCIRCQSRERSPGSMWCWACAPARSTSAAGRD